VLGIQINKSFWGSLGNEPDTAEHKEAEQNGNGARYRGPPRRLCLEAAQRVKQTTNPRQQLTFEQGDRSKRSFSKNLLTDVRE